MSQQIIIGIWLGLAIIAANLPWLSERWLFVIVRQGGQAKPFWLRLIEWGLLYALILAMGFGFEYKAAGTVQAQGWEFYTATLCLFMVGALPGFVYRYQLRRLLAQAGW
ncbi:MAG: DUF2818 family protein [Candidatus Competibacter denitrificans]|uniref:Transmembrane protein n=1 Tax=Candidatus Competibacter denitrificans Run_A_D11 TaxID=1400863 RepID=W6M5Z9_9GAMM|nr:DUF2818 family protein [Candidatus Competibacter denitrificans]CDI03102.1 conserved membrane hypothetical protein [Candidatus Competibacter denitrificans Run_A_D11]HAS87674.1 DUF2818 domain-containing protein [Candidatus Competibacteraceae bacterium]HRC68771.1 DUF2818 family protein [Candidatus Competibacter denitrificans]